MTNLVYVIPGLLIGVAASFTGLGGGFLVVPLLLALGYSPAQAVGTSFLVILIISLSAVWAHSQLRQVDGLAGLTLGLGGALGAPIGSRLLQTVPQAIFVRLFAGILLLVAWHLFRTASVTGEKTEEAAPIHQTWSKRRRGLTFFLFGGGVGVAAAFAGLGGGFLIVPATMHWGMTHARAVGTSLSATLVIAAAALIAHYHFGAVLVPLGLCLGLGGLIGAQIGSRWVRHVSPVSFRRLFSGVLVLVAIRTAWR